MLKKYLPLYRVLDYYQIVTTKEPKSFQEKAKSGFQLFKGTLFNVLAVISLGYQIRGLRSI